MPNLDPNVVPFANEYNKPTPNPKPELSAEVVRERLNNINNYMNTYGPGILKGMSQAQQDQDNYIAQVKSDRNQFVSPIPKIQNLISGDVMTGPNPSLRLNDLPTVDYVNTLIEKSKIESGGLEDPYAMMRPTAYNATSAGYNFDRYYSHDKFDEGLGFSIYRDNERIYNANSTAWDDFGRMGKKWFGLAYMGAADLFTNWGKFGAVGEAKDAAKMEEDLSAAMSSRSGAGAWATNFLANSAYTIGIMGEIAAEELVLWGATALTGGAASPLAALRTGQNVGRLGKSMKIMANLLNKTDEAKSFWNAAKGLGKSALKFVNPFEHTTDLAKMALNKDHAFHRLNDFAKMQKTFGAFYKDMRAINAVTSESRLEGGFAQNKVANEALDAFYKKEGRAPNTEEAKLISDKAFASGHATTLINMPAIFLSNKLVFGTYLKGFAPIRRIMSKEGLKSSLFRIVQNPNWKKAGLKPFEVINRGMFTSAKRTFSKSYLQSIPSRLSGTFSKKGLSAGFGSGLRYFSANLAEGLQESFQEATQTGVTDYYLNQYFADLYQDPHLAAKNTIGAAISNGIASQFSAQGLDVFAQGFLMGGVIGGVGNFIMPASQRVSMAARSMFDKGATSYSEYVKTEKERLQKFADAGNDYIQNTGQYINWLDENVKAQRDLAERYDRAEQTGDREEAESTKDESLFTHVHTLLASGGFDNFILHLEDLMELSDTDLSDAFPTGPNDQNVKSTREKLQTAIDKAKNIQERWDRINEKIENPYNPDFFDKTKDPEAYERERIGYAAFEKAKQVAVFYEYSFDRTVERLSSLVNNMAANSPLGAAAASDISALYHDPFGTSFDDYVKVVETEIEALQNGSAQEKTQAKKKQTQLNNLYDLKELMFKYKTHLADIDLAKQAFNDPENASEESKKALQKLKDLAKALAPDMIIYGDPTVDEETGQMSINFESEDIVNPDVIVLEHAKDILYEAYAKYLKNVADLRNVFPIQNSIENSFGDLIDYIHLDHKARRQAEFVTVLADPMSVYQMGARIEKSLSKIKDQRKALHEKAFLDYKENILDVDDLLQKLADMNVYFDPKAIAEFRKTGKLPNYFIDATSGAVIDKNSETYAKIVELIKNEEIRRGVTFNNKPVVPPPPASATPAATAPVSAQKPPEDELEEEEFTEATVLTPFKDLPENVKTLLKQLHDEAVATMGANTDIQEWMKDSPDAAAVIQGTYKPKEPVVPGAGKTEEEPPAETSGLITPENPRSVDTATPGTQAIYDQAAENNWELSDDKRTYQNKDKTKKSKRVSDLKESTIDATKPEVIAAQNRGNFVDELLRLFGKPVANGLSLKDTVINSVAQNLRSEQIKSTLQMWIRQQVKLNNLDSKNNVSVDQGFYEDMAAVLFELATRFQSYTWHTSLPTMVGTLAGDTYGGTIDLLLEKDGKYFIVDLKTSAAIRAGKEMYDLGDQIQQNAYAELFEQITGNPISGIYILNLTSKIASDNKTIQNLSFVERKKADGKKTILQSIPRKSVDELKGIKPKEGEGQKPPAAPTTDAKADITIGKVGNTNYEVKADGVYFEGKKLDNPENKTHRQLIEADIERRKQEELSKGINSFNAATTKESLQRVVKDWLDVDILSPEFSTPSVRGALGTPGGFERGKQVFLEDYAGLINDINKRINAKYNAELAALEGGGNLGQIATAPNPELVKKAAKFGFTEDHVKAMSKEERELIATATSKEDVKDLVNKYIKPAPVSTAKTPTSPNFNVTLRMASIEESLEFLHEKLDQLKMQSELNDDPYSNPYLYIADNLPRITPESARKETGVNVGSKQDINPSLLSKNGVSVQKAAELIAANSRTEGLDLDESFIRDEIIEILKQGKNNYKENNGKINKKDIEAVEYEIKVLMDEYEELKKLSSSPSNNKAKAPSRFAGKLIWAQVGTIDPKVFEDYDVIYANDIIDQVAKKMGITPEEGKTIHQTIESRTDKNEIFNAIRAEVDTLKKQGKTIISDNWYLQQNADVISSPAPSKALFMRGTKSEKASREAFEQYINANEARADTYKATQVKGWESKLGKGKSSVERQTNLTVKELFALGTKETTLVEDITQSSEGLPYLMNIMKMYAANPEIRKEYAVVNKDGSITILSPEEVVGLIKERAIKFTNLSGELANFNQEIDNIVKDMMAKEQPTVNQEDKSSAQDAINNATDASASGAAAASASDIANAAASKTQKQVDDEFEDSLGCK